MKTKNDSHILWIILAVVIIVIMAAYWWSHQTETYTAPIHSAQPQSTTQSPASPCPTALDSHGECNDLKG